MGVSTAAGAKLYIGTTAAVGTSDTFIEVGNITGLPAFGRTYNEVKFLPLADRGTQKFKGSYDDGSLTVPMGKDIADAGQAAMIVALDVDADYNFKVVDNDVVPVASSTVTVSIATPGVVSWTAHGLPAETAIKLSTTGALPTGLTAGTTYYVVPIDDDTFSVSATAGGSAIDTTGSGSGVDTATTVPAGSNQIFKAKVMSFTTARTTADNVIEASAMLSIKSGSIVETVHLP